MTDKKPWPPRVVPRPGVAPVSPRDAVEAAKRAQQDRPKPPEVTGRFDQPIPEDALPTARRGEGQPQLSEDSQRGLEALGRTMREQAARAAAEPPAPVEEDAKDVQIRAMHAALDAAGVTDGRDGVIAEAFKALGTVPPKSADQLEKEKTASKLRPLDISAYFMSNYAEQEVPVIDVPSFRLVVKFRSAQDAHEEFLMRELRKFRATSPPPSPLEMLQHQSRLALALQIRAYNGSAWPNVHKPDGTIDEANFQECLRLVGQIPDQVFRRCSQHAAWFNERIDEMLTDREVLGKS